MIMTTVAFTYIRDGKMRVMTRVVAEESIQDCIDYIDNVSLT